MTDQMPPAEAVQDIAALLRHWGAASREGALELAQRLAFTGMLTYQQAETAADLFPPRWVLDVIRANEIVRRAWECGGRAWADTLEALHVARRGPNRVFSNPWREYDQLVRRIGYDPLRP